MRYLDGITKPMDMSLHELREIVTDREAWRATVHGLQRVRHNRVTEQQQQFWMTLVGYSPQGHRESDMTEVMQHF